jgi:hypothetical protein
MAREQPGRLSFDPPGGADQLPEALAVSWNHTIRAAYDALAAPGSPLATRFFAIDFSEITEPAEASVKWFGDPAEPTFCIDATAARELSDWGVRGRHALHNEYCEYAVVHRRDERGRLRPKRVQVTTELREYWVCVAKHDPDAFRRMAEDVLGFAVGWEELYGVADPDGLTTEQREIAVGHVLAGHGNDDRLQQAGVPAQPTGTLNTENALFMTHPINGLDDLIYIVLFGAKPYAVREAGERRPATREEIFVFHHVEQLACRHADPAAALGAHDAAWAGRQVAFANPLGMYLQSFARELFLVGGDPVPDAWVRWSRGKEGTYQRLEFGPGDEDGRFLDDIRVAAGASEEPLLGGFQVVQQLEVGPGVLAGPPSAIEEEEYVDLEVDEVSIACHEAEVCRGIAQLKAEYDRERRSGRAGPRNTGRGG